MINVQMLIVVYRCLGRAWLYDALSDHLLESYVRCFVDNKKLVKSFYVQDALVLDYQVFQWCSTLFYGIVHISLGLY